jgi:hypothetical protein
MTVEPHHLKLSVNQITEAVEAQTRAQDEIAHETLKATRELTQAVYCLASILENR